VERVLARALDKDPAQRYQHARELADDLRQAFGPAPAAGALNETMSLSATTAVPLSELAPPLPERSLVWPARLGRLGKLLGSPTWERLATDAWVTALACVLIGAAALLSLGWGPVPPPPPGEQARGEVVRLMAEGHVMLQQQRYEEAIARLTRAEKLAPELERPRRLREMAEAKAEELKSQAEQEQRLQAQLEQAELFAKQRNPQGAAILAQAVLFVDPQHARAREILDRANERLLREGRQPVAAASRRPEHLERAETRSPAGVPVPDGAGSSAAPVPSRVVLMFRLDTGLPKGRYEVRYNGRRIYEDGFDFYERKRFARDIPRGGQVNEALMVPAGRATLEVKVTPQDRLSREKSTVAELVGGQIHQLTAVLDPEGKLRVFMEDPASS
jgi:hypothetical protein